MNHLADGGHSVLTLSHLFPSEGSPGVGPFVRDQVAELAKRNRMTVVAPVRRPFGLRRPLANQDEGLRPEGEIQVARPRLPSIPVGGLLVESPLWATRLAPLLRTLSRDFEIDLVHAHFGLPDGYAAACFANDVRVPLVVTLLGSDALIFGAKRRLRPLFKRTFDQAGAIIAVSAEVGHRAKELGAPQGRIKVIPYGVPFRPSLSRVEARANLGLEDGVTCVLWVGRLAPVKQPGDAILAFKQFVQLGHERSVLVMLGDGPLRGRMTALVREVGLDRSIRLMGYVPDDQVWLWQSAADISLISSRSEGTPLTLLESLGAGTPAAVYRVGGVPDALGLVSGGVVAGDQTPEELARAMDDVLARPLDRMRLAERARESFDISVTAAAIERLYASLV
jgi:glycosyltransferase involved in cell wall biosynthesis